MTKPFAYFEGEEPEQTAAYIDGLEVTLVGAKQRGELDAAKDIEAELHRMRGEPAKQTRPRGTAAQKRVK